MTSAPLADHAIEQHRAQPHLLGPVLRAARLLAAEGRAVEAQALADTYAGHFDGAPDGGQALVALAAQSPTRTFTDGAPIIVEGHASDAMFLVLDGVARVERKGAGVLARLGVGQTFGEIALLARTPRTASVIAEGTTTVLGVTRKAMAAVAQRFPPLERIVQAVYRDRLLAQLIPTGSSFSTLDPSQRHALFSRFVPCAVPSATPVLREGQEGPGFFVIVSGRVAVWRKTLNLQREDVATLGPGEYFGEISLLYEMPCTATVEALEPLTYFALRREDFHAVMKSYPEQIQRVMAVARQRLGYEQKGDRGIDIGMWNVGLDADQQMWEVNAGGAPDPVDLTGSMTCPRCGYDQAEGLTCVACGANIERERGRASRLTATIPGLGD